jgi:hypothetical protein
MKIGKAIYDPNIINSSNVLIHVQNNLVSNSKNDENSLNYKLFN